MTIFDKEGCYEAFEGVLPAAVEGTGTRMLAICLFQSAFQRSLYRREFVIWKTF